MPIDVKELNQSTTPCYSALASKEGITPRKLLKEIKLIAFSDVADHCEIAEGGELRFKTFEEQGKKRRAIKSLKEKTVITESKDGERIFKTSTVEYTMYDKLDALDMGMSIHGMKKPIKQDLKHSGVIFVENSIPLPGDDEAPPEIVGPGATSKAEIGKNGQ